MWLVSVRWDLAWMAGPAFLAAGGALLWPEALALPFAGWLLLVVGVDVAHTWASLYRTALDPQAEPGLLGKAASIALIGALLLWMLAPSAFWPGMAAVAIFHFIRQQGGVLALYQAHDAQLSPLEKAVERRLIEALCLLPLVYWASHLPRAFAWFSPADFGPGLPAWVLPPAALLTGGLFLWHVALRLRSRRLAWGRDLWVLGTGASWSAGILLTNSDGAFTIANVLPHGISYFALVYRVGARQWSEGAGPAWAPLYRRWLLWLLLPLGAAFAEEALWEVFVNQELDLSPFDPVSALTPLLAVPQLTHYLLDGWIWKMPPGSPLRRWLELPC